MSKEMKCNDCHLFTTLCICSLLNPYQTKTRVSLLIHKAEARKMTNTGILAHRLLQNSQAFICGEKDKLLQEEDFLHSKYQNVLLFPGGSSEILPKNNKNSKPYNIIVPDGHWGQARSIANKVKKISPQIKFMSIPKSQASEYGLRSHPDLSKICTIEAISRVLHLVEPEGSHERLLDVFRVMRNRLLNKRGQMI